MRKIAFRIIALCITVSLLFSGCGVIDLSRYFDRLMNSVTISTPFADMEYQRPDMTQLEEVLNDCLESAATETDVTVLTDKVWEFYDLYSNFSTQYLLAYIHYCIDMTDIYWEAEYTYCAENTAAADAGLDQLMYALADSPLRKELEHEDYFGEGYFDAYDGESLWDEEFTALMEQEASLQTEYYDLSAEAMASEYYSEEYFAVYGAQMEEIFVELVALRQQLAAQAGYDSYPEFAYDFYHCRDYTPGDTADYVENIRQQLVPLYRQLNGSGFWDQPPQYSTTEETFRYVQQMAEEMGGVIQEAFELMERAELYHIDFGDNKYGGSYEVFLPDYWEPFIFISPVGTVQDQLTFAHEFGHFCNDYASYGSAAGIDVAEFFSQGMEYLSLCYGESNAVTEKAKMADSLSIYVEQAAYAAFEHQVYGLTGSDLTAENVRALYEQIGLAYGFDTWDWDSRDYVCVSHFFTDPMYIISYVVSNDASMQLYQMEQTTPGAGLACYTDNLATQQEYFHGFLTEAGLEAPFDRIEAVKKTFENVL